MGTYASVEDMRLQGASVSGFSDAQLEAALEEASRTIDRLTGFFFEARTERTYLLDGDGSPILELPAPCLTLTSVTMDNSTVDLTGIINRTRPIEECDDYWYPRLEWKSGPLRLQRAFGLQRNRSVWWLGEQNIEVKGTFGFVVASVSPTGSLVAPPDIKRACMMLAEILVQPVANTDSQDARLGRFKQSESMGNYSYSFGGGAGGGKGNSYMTGDPDIDSILLRYTRSQMSTGGWR